MTNASVRCLVTILSMLLTVTTKAEPNKKLVKTFYPGAQVWFEKMNKKYPAAQLENVLFYAYDHYGSSPDAICFPESDVVEIHNIYTRSNLNELERELLFKNCEHSLLHEAAHVLLKHNQTGYLVFFDLIISSIIINAIIINQTSLNLKSIASSAMLSAAYAAIATISLSLYIRSQENDADDFANSIGDRETLEAAAKEYFMAHENRHAGKNRTNTAMILADIYADPIHPSLKSRADKIIKSLNSRFLGNLNDSTQPA